MNKSDIISSLRNQTDKLQRDLKHLNNELRLTRAEHKDSTKKYFDLCLELEEKVLKITDETEKSKEKLKDEARERLAAEDTLRQNEIYLKAIMNSIPIGIVIIDADTRLIIDINPALTELLGMTKQKIIGEMCHKLICPNKKQGGCPAFNLQQTCEQSEHTVTTSNGDKIHLLKTATSLKLSKHRYIVETFQNISARKKLEEKLKKLVVTDEMTGLLNRRGFTTMGKKLLQIAKRSGNKLFLLYTDFDNLKLINDNLGHTVGDQAIIETSNLLKNTFRQTDIIGRIGGDEFVMLFMDKTDPNSKESTIKRLEKSLTKINSRPNHPYKIALSYGISHYSSIDCTTIEDMLSQADQLMYKVKKEKKKEMLAGYAKQ